jgi:hypothetical protein
MTKLALAKWKRRPHLDRERKIEKKIEKKKEVYSFMNGTEKVNNN